MINNKLHHCNSLFFIAIILLMISGCSSQILLKSILPNIDQYRFGMPETSIENVFENKNKDEDKDGIYNAIDKCPHTLPGTIINWLGCPRNSHQSNPLYIISNQPLSKN